ncbi:amidohydrolase family protein [Phycisphaerales bacterium AB-hyl4]|uniref:Amidohydrolase family protein n=1 Tax=Natronomicrosphaera hydrolytica TaxID=3242702 RepID=A0ABV4U641_9BACT
MIVDCHTHLWLPHELTDELAIEAGLIRGEPLDLSVTPEQHRAATAGVDKAIVFGLRAPLVGFLSENDTVADYVKTDPAKYIGFAAINPAEAGALDELERAVADLGLRGLKMTPIYSGYHPHDERAWPIYARAEKLGLPILFHQGTTFPRKAPLKYAHPEQLEDIALRHPDLKMIIAHMGHPWENEAIALIRKQPNVFADISALYYRPWQFYNMLRLAYEYGATGKLLFGTDYPIATFEDTVAGLREVVRCSREQWQVPELPAELPDEILYRDTLGLLGLD